jgi:hypothetical protein
VDIFGKRRTFWVRGSECQGGPTKTGMQPARKASVRRWLDWLLPGRMRQKALLAICSSTALCRCVANSFCANSRSVHLTCGQRITLSLGSCQC